MERTEVSKSLNLIWHPHPISAIADREVQAFVFTPGLSVRQLLLKSGVDPIQPIYVVLDDKLLTVEQWDTVYPEEGQILNVQATIQGGDNGGGSNAGQIIAMVAVIAIAIAAPYMAPASWGLLTASGAVSLTGALVTAGVMIAGSLIVGAIFQPKTNTGLSEVSSSQQESPTYSLSGGSNRLRPYESMPVIMGQHRFFPDAAMKPYTEYLSNEQYLYQAFNLGLSSAYFSDWKIGTTPIESYSNWSWRYHNSQGKFYDFPGNVDSIAGAVLTKSGGAVTRTTSSDTYKIGIDIESVLFYANDAGGMDDRTVELLIEYRPVGTYTWQQGLIISSNKSAVAGTYVTETYTEESGYWDGYYNPDTGESGSTWHDTSVTKTRTVFYAGGGGVIRITGNSQKAIRTSLELNVATDQYYPGQYEVRITRNTDDSTSSREQTSTTWSVLKSYQLDNGDYTGQNRQGLVIKATEQLNGAVQQLSAMASSNAIYWSGTSWTSGPTSNPAHWFMDFAIGHRDTNGKLLYGIGMSANQLDLAALHTWAQFCATEGLTFNAVLDGSQTAADVLTSIARCGFGSPSWASGKLGIVYDARQSTPVAAFGMSNIIKDTFAVAYITEELADEIVVRYVDPDNDWNQSEVRVVVPGVTNPVRTSSVDVFGCTNAAMAGKFANYLAAQQYYRRRRISWETDFQGFVCNRGDVVLLSHDLTQWAYSGRFVSVDGDTVSIDRHVPRNGTQEYLMLVRPDGSTTVYTVEAANIDQDTLTLTTPIELQEGYLPMDHMWFFSPLATPGKRVKILSVSPASESRVRITATDEYDEFYNAWDGAFIQPTIDTLLPSVPVAVTNLTLNNRVAIENGYRVNRVGANWKVSGTTQYSIVKVYIDGNLVLEQAENLTGSVEIDIQAAGTVRVDVTPVGVIGVGETSTSTLVIGQLDAPQPPSSMTLTYGEDGKSATFTWPQVIGAQSYVIEIVVGGTVKRQQNVGNAQSFEYTLEQSKVDGGPYRNYTARVYSVANDIQSETYASASFANAQIGQLINARIEPMPNSIWFQCDAPVEADWEGIQVWISKDANFTPSSATLSYDGKETWVTIGADANGDPLESAVVYYVYAAAYDSFGKDSLTLTAKLSTTILSPAWGLVQGDIDETVLSLGLNERIDLIDTTPVAVIDAMGITDGIITKVRNQATDIEVLDTSLNTISDTLLDTVNNLNQYQAEVYDAGLTIDPETGEAYIYGIRENSERIDAAEIRLDAAEASITLKASTAYVDQAIATAVIDPSQVAELDDLYARIGTAEVDINGLEASVALKADLTTVNSQGARLTTAESDINALEASVSTKVETVVFDQLGARVTVTEQTLEALDVSEITQSVSQVRYLEKNQEVEAEALLRSILQGEKNYTESDANIAYASNTLRAYVDEGISAEASARLELAVDLGETQAALEDEKIVRATADSAEASAREALAARVTDAETGLATANAAIVTEQNARATADTALSNSITALTSTVNTNNATVNAAIQSEATTRASNDTALSNQINSLSATVTTNNNTQTAAIQSEATTRANDDAALSSSISTVSATANAKNRSYRQATAPQANLVDGDIWFDSDDNNKSYRYNGLSWVATDDTRIAANVAAIQTESTTRANADSALASSISTIQTTVDGHTTSIQTNATSIDGIEGKYAVKVDNNGYVSGFGLISTANNATPFSEFTIVADRFSLAPVATNPSAVDGSPFFVLTSPTVIDGVTIPAGTYMKKAFIHDASITTAKIADASIDNAKIANLDAGKITTGTLNADRIAVGSLDAKIATLDGAKINNATITTAKIGDLQVDTIKIANNAVTSSLAVSVGSRQLTTTPTSIISGSFTSTNSPRIISIACEFRFSSATISTATIYVELKINGVSRRSWAQLYNGIWYLNFYDNFSYTTMNFEVFAADYSSFQGFTSATSTTVTIVEYKK